MSDRLIVQNRQASFHYEILERFEAGIVLQGTEVKSLREKKVRITEAYCHITQEHQLQLHQMHISPYAYGNQFNHEADRMRPLLMHKREIKKLAAKMQQKGLAIIPTKLYFRRQFVKVQIALCRGKKTHDKRAALKAKEADRDMRRALKRDAIF